MSVKTQHSDYMRMSGKWKRCRDVAAGQDAVHEAGCAYLPRLKDQTDDDYNAYKMRATFYNATWRTIAGLIGMLYRKPPVKEVPGVIELLLKDVTMAGVPLHVFAQQVTEECMTVGRVGVFDDFPIAPEGATMADAARLNLRPTMCLYKTEQIINWRMREVNNQYVLSLVVLQYEHSEPDGEFKEKTETRYRVLDLEPLTNQYRMRVFRVKTDAGKDQDEQIGVDAYPLMNNQRMGFIPFWIIGVDDITPNVDDPPLIDLVDLNLSHYRTTADYEHGCHFTGLPTAWIAGYNPEQKADGSPADRLYIGSAAAWVFPDPNAKADFLEFSGQGLNALEKNLERKESQMAILGARMLEVQKKAAEAAETAGIHRAGESSVLASAAQTISLGITKALEVFCQWAGANGEVKFELNRDFFPMPMSPQMFKELVGAWQSGAISFDTLFDNLKRGEIHSAEATAEDEKGKIEAEGPSLGTLEDAPNPAAANA